jgi:hypothetical protein
MTQPFLLEHISAKNLGSLAMPDLCPRCFWTKARMGFKTPFGSFPSIFSHIDTYSKDITKAHLAAHQNIAPSWLMKFGSLQTQVPCPHWSKFAFRDPVSLILLRGSPDEMFRLADGTLGIFDYKTARFSEHQDELLPVYKVQLSVYRWLALKLGMGETSAAGLVYYEPDTHGAAPDKITEGGFLMGFTAHILPIQTDLAQVESLLLEAKKLANATECPQSRKGCKDCEMVDHMLALRRDSVARA